MKFSLVLALATSAVLVNASAKPHSRRHGALKARQGTTIITAACQSDSDCASGCCGFTLGTCEGPCVALQRDGCGHGNAVSNSNAAAALGVCSSLVANYVPSAAAGGVAAVTSSAAAVSTANAAGATPTVTVTVTETVSDCAVSSTAAAGTGTASTSAARGTQFITGACSSNNDCVSGCCVSAKGTCGAVGAQKNGAADCDGGVALPNLDA